jgi:ribonuclease/clavin/mitogillin
MNIVNVGYDSTNYYVFGQSNARLLIDVGWPGTLPKLLASLKRKDIPLQDIRYLLITHYHPDHAGLAQELKEKGTRLIVLESQVSAIPVLKTHMKPINRYVDIRLDDNLELGFAESRQFLLSVGLEGEIVSTPGHSDDSITLILDEGLAFTGDLLSPMLMADEARHQAELSWAKIRNHHVKTIYPGHGPIRPLIDPKSLEDL